MIPPELLTLRQDTYARQGDFQQALTAWTVAYQQPTSHASLVALRAACQVTGAAYETALSALLTCLGGDVGSVVDGEGERERAQRMRALLQRELAIVDRETHAKE